MMTADMQTSQLDQAFSRIEAMAKRDGTDAELLVETGERLSIGVSAGDIDRFEAEQSCVAGLRIIFDGVEGYSWTESLEATDLENAYKEAFENAKFAVRGRTSGSDRVELFSGPPVAEDATLFNSSLGRISLEEKLDRARRLESVAKSVDSRIEKVPYNRYWESSSDHSIYNTRGVRARQRETASGGYSYVLAKQGEESRMAGESFYSRDAQTAPVDAVAKSSAEKAIGKLGSTAPTTGQYAVVLDREVVAELIELFAGYFSAKSVSERTSLFGDATKNELGKMVASPLVSLTDDPNLSGGVGNRPFDAEGAATKKTRLIEAGRLNAFLTNSFYSKKLNMPHTASATRSAKTQLQIGYSNLVLEPGNNTFEQLVSGSEPVIYVNDISGLHSGFRAGSGEFSLPAEGELWQNGKRVKSICNFVISGSVRELLNGVEKVSSRMSDCTRAVVAPDLRIKSLSIAG